MYVWRKVNDSKSLLSRLLWRILLRTLSIRYGFQIALESRIGAGLFIGHFGTVVVSAMAEIGNNCNLAHGITLGAARGKRAGAPKLGDRVWVGTGAVLVGNIKIGSDVLIAPNAYVNIDVPENTLVIGNPAQLIHKINPTQDYINNQWVI